VSGFTHRITNQIRGADISPAQARRFLEQGWVDDELWLLRTLHEFAHAHLNSSPVAEALALAELSLDRQLYDALSANTDPSHISAGRDSLTLAYDMLSPCSEAIALITEWDLDLTVDLPTAPHRWMAQLVGSDTWDERLWRARLSPLGIAKKKNTLVSSCYESGHLLGLLLSRALRIPGDLHSREVLAMIMRCVFCNIDLAHAILDLAESATSALAVERARADLLNVLAEAANLLCEELLDGLSAEYSERLETGTEELLQRMQPLAREFEAPAGPAPRQMDGQGLRDMARAIARFSYSVRHLIGLGSIPVDLVAHGSRISCVVEGVDLYSFDNKVGFDGAGRGTIERSFCATCGPEAMGLRVSSDTHGILHAHSDDDHIVRAFRRARLPTATVEEAQAAAALLMEAATNAGPISPPGPTPSRQVAARFIGLIMQSATGVSIDLQGLSPYGVAKALGWDPGLLTALARLSNEYSSTWTPSGLAQLPGGPTVTDDQLGDLNARLHAATGLALAAPTASAGVLLW
jgi:hypothetical protein